MRPEEVIRTAEVIGEKSGTFFTIDNASEAHIMQILRDKLYSDKILAVIREYSTNAWDAHIVAGIKQPIRVVVPGPWEDSFSVRDFGPGLSEEEVYETYVRYGKSTKRDTDDQVGMLGLGSKSAFCYVDQFTVTSFHEGRKRVFAAFDDPSRRGKMVKLLDVAQPDNVPHETGIEVKVQVRPGDVKAFSNKARDFFRFWPVRPLINIAIPEPIPLTSEKGWVTRDDLAISDNATLAVMGCVPYKFNPQSIRELLSDRTRNLIDRVSARRISIGMILPIGSVSIAASREELEYTDKTKAGLAKAVEEVVTGTWARIEQEAAASPNDFQRALFYKRKVTSLGLAIAPKVIEDVLGYLGFPSSFAHRHLNVVKRGTVHKIVTGQAFQLHEELQFVIWDQPKAFNRRYLSTKYRDPRVIFVLPRLPEGALDIKAWADTALKDTLNAVTAIHISGCPVRKFSEIPDILPTKEETERERVTYPVNPKYKKNFFVFQTNANGTRTKSGSALWEVATDAMGPNDAYVFLDAFTSRDPVSRGHYPASRLEVVSEILESQTPPGRLFGVRTTKRYLPTVESLPGKPVDKYLDELVENLPLDAVQQTTKRILYSSIPNTFRKVSPEYRKKQIDAVIRALPAQHEWVDVLRGIDALLETNLDLPKELAWLGYNIIEERLTRRRVALNLHLEYDLKQGKSYPLITYSPSEVLAELFEENSDALRLKHMGLYIAAVDAAAQRATEQRVLVVDAIDSF